VDAQKFRGLDSFRLNLALDGLRSGGFYEGFIDKL
jgi:hypothetical protein